MSGDGKGLQLTLRLRRLELRHRIRQSSWEDIVHVPMSPPTDTPQILQGFACAPDQDLHRTRIRFYALGYPLPKYCQRVLCC